MQLFIFRLNILFSRGFFPYEKRHFVSHDSFCRSNKEGKNIQGVEGFL